MIAKAQLQLPPTDVSYSSPLPMNEHIYESQAPSDASIHLVASQTALHEISALEKLHYSTPKAVIYDHQY
jgi:hypothetical protein